MPSRFVLEAWVVTRSPATGHQGQTSVAGQQTGLIRRITNVSEVSAATEGQRNTPRTLRQQKRAASKITETRFGALPAIACRQAATVTTGIIDC